jgi:murein DD-endopeptidase MepM/ murein hydrolase activator NlpD
LSQRYGHGHTGIDIDGDTGDPVYAAAGGTVTFAGYTGGYGKCILIRHSNGLTTRYAHCSSISVSSGEKVSGGENIGRVGSTGRSTGSHLHFEVISGGSTRNPLNYLR